VDLRLTFWLLRPTADWVLGIGVRAVLWRWCGSGFGWSDNLIARFEAGYSVSDDFIDVWRTAEDKFVKSWEDRFIKTEGYHKNVTRVVRGLLQKYGLSPLDFQKAVIPTPDVRSLREVGKSLGFDPRTQIQDPLLSTVGDTGTAQPLLLLAACLEEAKPNDKILLVGYGDGAQALVFSVTEKIEKREEHRCGGCGIQDAFESL